MDTFVDSSWYFLRYTSAGFEDGPYDPELTIRGTYRHPVNTSALYYHMDYHRESMGGSNFVGTFWLNVKDPSKMAQISQQIDAMFKNSEYPTETFTEKEFQKSFISMMGNIQQLFPVWNDVSTWNLAALSGITRSYTVTIGNLTASAPLKVGAGWVQDDWQVTPRFTLNLGLRYDIETGAFAEDTTLAPFLQAGRPIEKTNFGPRLGFAHRLTDSTVLHGVNKITRVLKEDREAFNIVQELTTRIKQGR